MTLFSKSICSILLASSFLFNIAYGERDLIGYRIAPDKEAAYINEHNHPPTEIEFYEAFNDQLGKAFHMINDPAPTWASWPDTQWYCAIEGDMEKVRDMRKMWIPHLNDLYDSGLWYREEKDIIEYIERFVTDDADKVLRFSHGYCSERYENQLNMAIPFELVKGNYFELWGQCWGTSDELEEYVSGKGKDPSINIPWKSWDIEGSPGPRDKFPASTSRGGC
ncbi:hypothetical protein LZ554_001729 [Drepanopeziza brunnea f. sp. 'monogermtubi']|nr:hypothetical protein LZ554_001729 [Drepanopeziza brunnea f. sp. 'monogermtubi']